jgi:hypothetical protein
MYILALIEIYPCPDNSSLHQQNPTTPCLLRAAIARRAVIRHGLSVVDPTLQIAVAAVGMVAVVCVTAADVEAPGDRKRIGEDRGREGGQDGQSGCGCVSSAISSTSVEPCRRGPDAVGDVWSTELTREMEKRELHGVWRRYDQALWLSALMTAPLVSVCVLLFALKLRCPIWPRHPGSNDACLI